MPELLPTEPHPEIPASRIEPQVEAQLLYAAYDRMRLNLWFTLGCVVVFIPLLWGHFAPRLLIVALASMLIGVSAGFLWHLAFRRAAPPPGEIAKWRRRFLVHCMFSGATWTLGPTLMLMQASGAQMALLIGVLTCVCSVIMISVAEQRGAVEAFLVFALVPPIAAIVYSASDSGIEYMTALVLLTGMVLMIVVGQRSHRAVRKLLQTEVQLRVAIQESSAAREAAERSNAAKSTFLSRMSHELRTPLHAILGFAESLEHDTGVARSSQRDVQEILNGGRHLLGLINELLDVTAIESGHIKLQSESVSVTELIAECLQLMQPLAQAQHVSLHNDLLDVTDVADGEVVVQADRLRVRQSLLNLLSNAIKYNHAGGAVRVYTRVLPNERVRITVSDTGAGIPAEHMAHLFEPFNRLQFAKSAIDGVGVGLSITRNLVQLMGGEVGVTSQPGVGSDFWIELPAAARSEQPAALAVGATLDSADAAPRQRRLLYIDDRPENLRLIERLLATRPHIEVMATEHALSGIDWARANRPDLILLDINMPVMDGYQVLDALKRDPALSAAPIIALSADAMPHDIQRGLAAGFTDYLTKPLNRTDFLKTMDRYLWSTTADITVMDRRKRQSLRQNG